MTTNCAQEAVTSNAAQWWHVWHVLARCAELNPPPHFHNLNKFDPTQAPTVLPGFEAPVVSSRIQSPPVISSRLRSPPVAIGA